jgi:hypothetical protein
MRSSCSAWCSANARSAPEGHTELAYERVEAPGTEIELNPEDEQVVNLPTWIWLDGAEFEPVEVTATASLTWRVTWEGSDGRGGTLPDGVFATTHEVEVQEAQTIVR